MSFATGTIDVVALERNGIRSFPLFAQPSSSVKVHEHYFPANAFPAMILKPIAISVHKVNLPSHRM